jgi:Kef-type K+ transport system membrane component KefB
VSLQVAITLTLTRVLGKLFGYIKQPQVIGEIVAGILLGPSVLGQIPGAWLCEGSAQVSQQQQ